jgi:hypothetical protein
VAHLGDLMVSSKSHDIVAKRIAKSRKSEYNEGQGPDINTPEIVVEVETPETVKDGLRQLRGFRKPVYIAGSNKEAVKKAEEVTKGTTVGVMDPGGNIIKKSTRKRSKKK